MSEKRTESALREEPLVSEQSLLDEVVGSIAGSAEIAVDTEFVRERTYFPQLCLIQVASEEVIACLDCLAATDFDGLRGALFRDDCTWVLHSARQDLEVLTNRFGALPKHLFDTQIAAGLTGFAPQVGLQDLLASTIGVQIAKGHARTDWSRRPLHEDALRYALDDVRYLLDVRRHLTQRLAELGRSAWFEEDSRRLLTDAGATDLVTIWRRLKGVARLDPARQRIALALVAWRESRARRLDRPRRWVVGDELLVRLAQTMPDSLHALRSIELPKRLAARSGEEILHAIQAADHERLAAELAAERSAPADKGVLKELRQKVKQRADELGLYPEVLATRRDLAMLAAGDRPALLERGWRAEQLRDVVGR